MDSNPGSSAVEADVLPLGQRGGRARHKTVSLSSINRLLSLAGVKQTVSDRCRIDCCYIARTIVDFPKKTTKLTKKDKNSSKGLKYIQIYILLKNIEQKI